MCSEERASMYISQKDAPNLFILHTLYRIKLGPFFLVALRHNFNQLVSDSFNFECEWPVRGTQYD